jgi:hypothetical protein
MGAFRYSEISLMSIDLRASYRQARPAMLSVGNCCQAAAMVRNRVANLDSQPKHEAEFVEPMECALVSKLARLMTLFGEQPQGCSFVAQTQPRSEPTGLTRSEMCFLRWLKR